MDYSSLKNDYIQAMRRYASTVNVVSATHNGVKQAMTATSVASLSLDPPSILVSINTAASIHQILAKDRDFCINVLSNTQKEIAEICSKNEEEDNRFKLGNWSDNKEIPFSLDAQSNLFCRCFDVFKQNTHSVFFGEVFSVINNESIGPLLYFDGDYLNK